MYFVMSALACHLVRIRVAISAGAARRVTLGRAQLSLFVRAPRFRQIQRFFHRLA